jgi:hypothetical protein
VSRASASSIRRSAIELATLWSCSHTDDASYPARAVQQTPASTGRGFSMFNLYVTIAFIAFIAFERRLAFNERRRIIADTMTATLR